MTLQRSRRRVLALCGGVGAALAGCTAPTLAEPEFEPLTELHGDRPVAYENERLRLRAPEDPVSRGATVDFEVRNHGESRVTLGCHNPWTIQVRRDGGWYDVIWTSADLIPLCATLLRSGGSIVEEVTLTRDALAGDGEELRAELTPGRYRFVLLGPTPFLAVDFRLVD